jgi:integrase
MSLTVRKRGRFWFARGTVPSLQASGKIVNVRVERSLRAESRKDAIAKAADIDRYYWELAYRPKPKCGPTFAEAAKTYILTKGRSDRFLTKLIEHFKDTPIDQIDQRAATDASSKLYPGWKASSLSRAVYTPLCAIGVRGLKRPSCATAPLGIPDERWFDSVIRHAPPKLAALIIFLTLTGRRVGEALALTEKDIDENGCAHICRTKTGTAVLVRVPDLCRAMLADADTYYSRRGVGQPSKRLFGYASLQSASVALRRTCERAGVPYYSFLKVGRHSFATRGLKAGKSIKWLQIAGGWKSHKSLDRYLHLEQSEVARDVEELGAEWSRGRMKK